MQASFTARRTHLVWPFAKRKLDSAERYKALYTYRRVFTQPKQLARLRAEFDAAVRIGSENGTSPELLSMLQEHAIDITRLMSDHWGAMLRAEGGWPVLADRRGEELAEELRQLFVSYVEKTLRWLDYFIRDPRWLNLTAVNYAANAAREAASEVREARSRFELAYELTRKDLLTDRNGPADESSKAA